MVDAAVDARAAALRAAAVAGIAGVAAVDGILIADFASAVTTRLLVAAAVASCMLLQPSGTTGPGDSAD